MIALSAMTGPDIVLLVYALFFTFLAGCLCFDLLCLVAALVVTAAGWVWKQVQALAGTAPTGEPR